MSPRLFVLLLAAILAVAATPVSAAVRITFYSKELGSSFPHAFVILQGTLERSGERIDEDYGFTAKSVSPAILMGAVKGEVVTDHSPSYVRGSERHFTVTVTDAEYERAMGVVARWRAMRQPSYDLGTRNCIHFVAEIAASLGMRADTPRRLTRRPRSYLEYLTQSNRPWLQARGAIIHRPAGGVTARPGSG